MVEVREKEMAPQRMLNEDVRLLEGLTFVVDLIFFATGFGVFLGLRSSIARLIVLPEHPMTSAASCVEKPRSMRLFTFALNALLRSFVGCVFVLLIPA